MRTPARTTALVAAALLTGAAIAPAWALMFGGTDIERLDRIEANTCTLLAAAGATPATCTPTVTVPATTPTTPATVATTPPTVATTPPTVATTPPTVPTTPPTIPSTTPVIPSTPGCRVAAAVFCETFDGPRGNGGRTGDLDPVLWGVSRIGDINPPQLTINNVQNTGVQGCGNPGPVAPPSDVRICNGKLFEAQNDNHIVVSLTMYPKQPFDFGGRTGTVGFDVSADSQGSHGAWPEFVITDKPVPGIRGAIGDEVPPSSPNSVGFALDGSCGTPADSNLTGVGSVFVTRGGSYSNVPFTIPTCVTKGNANALNHIEARVSQNRLEVWGTDGGGTTMKQLAVADNLGLSFTSGLVWMNDVHYNARKAIEPGEQGTQFEHTFVWDNLAFDGPKTYRDLGFDVPDANDHVGDSTREGYLVGFGPITLNVPGVRRNQPPTGAQLVLNTYSFAPLVPSISVNGGPWIDTPWPFDPRAGSWRSLSIPIPLDQIRDGNNTVAFRSADPTTVVANVSLILVAAAAVP